MKRILRLSLLAAAIFLPLTSAAAQETPALELGLRRDFGFSAGNRIQGTFTLSVSGPEDLVEVIFLIDGQSVRVDGEPPYRYQFSTSAYPLGPHTLTAAARTADGQDLRAPERTLEFVSAEEGWKVSLQIVGPILALVLVVSVLGVVGPVLMDRRGKRFQPGVYGAAGGAVCPRCTLPYSRNLLSPNLLFGKLERCPHCGKWAIGRAASRSELDAAEVRLRQDSQRGALEAGDERERLQQEIEDSRFDR